MRKGEHRSTEEDVTLDFMARLVKDYGEQNQLVAPGKWAGLPYPIVGVLSLSVDSTFNAEGAFSQNGFSFPNAGGGDRPRWVRTHDRELLSGQSGAAAHARGLGAARRRDEETVGLSDQRDPVLEETGLSMMPSR